MTHNIFKTLLKLLRTYKSTNYSTPVDFVEEQLKKGELSVDDVQVDKFIELTKHEEFLDKISEQFISSNKFKLMKFNRSTLNVLIYFIIFLLDETNFQDILHLSMYHLRSILYFLSSEEQYAFIAKTASTFFESDYVINIIMHPILNKAQVLKTLAKYIVEQENNKIPKLSPTKPSEFNFSSDKSAPPPPLNTPIQEKGLLFPIKVPKTNYLPDLSVQNSINQNHYKNLMKAKNLLTVAMQMPSHLTDPKKYKIPVVPEPEKLKARKAPSTLKKYVQIKGNLAATLRQAAHLMKDEENEISRIEEIIRGGLNMRKIQEIEQEDRRKAEKEAIEDIQKKHLYGLITFEEAILAKKNLLKINKMRTLEMKATKLELAEKLEKWKLEEQEKVKAQVNGGSPAERAGLIAGDSVIKINNTDVFNLRHKDAQDVVVRAGHNFEVTIQRGGSTWKPSVIPTGQFSKPTPNINNINPVTRTSLAAQKTENIGAIGTGHNLAAKPFSPQLNGAVNGGSKLVNKQYNSPVKLYSEESIAETLSAQTEVLSTGALGVNFKKNEKNYDASNSAVLRMLKESENEPRTTEEEPDAGVVTAPNIGIAGLRRVQAPENRPAPANPQLPPGQNICADCERLIVGVFVRIKEKNLHVECFKCSTCGSSLKNVGYYNINNKLYCDIHAKSAALKNSSNPNLIPITVPPGGKAPAHAISSALSSHSLPTPSPISPKINNNYAPSYQAQENNENVDVSSSVPVLPKSNVNEANNNNSLFSTATPVSFSKFINKSSNISGPKPFSSVTAPHPTYNTLPKTAPLSPVAPPAPHFNNSYNSPSFSPISTTDNTFNSKPRPFSLVLE